MFYFSSLLYFPPGTDRPGQGLPEGRHAHPRGDGDGGRAARRQLGLEEAHRLRGAEEPGRHLLHELPPADALLHQQAAQGGLPDADGERRQHEERRPRPAARLLRPAVQRQAGGHEEADQVLWLGDARLLHAARRPGALSGAAGQHGEQDEGHHRGGHHSQSL